MNGAARELVVRLMHSGDDLDAELDLRHRAFGPMDDADREYCLAKVRACVAGSRLFGVWDGRRLIGAGRFYDLRQWWYGKALPTAAVAGVKVAPEARGRGVGRALMTAMLGAMAERGYPLAVLYPATAHLYRSLGWEMAGGYYEVEIPGRSLGSLLPPDPEIPAGPAVLGEPAGLGGPGAGAVLPDAGPGQVPLRRAVPDDAEAVIAVLGAVYAAARDCGPCTFDAVSVRQMLGDPDVFAYLADDGFLSYGWDGSAHQIAVHVLQAGSARTARTLWGILASHASVTEVVRATVSPRDPVGWLVREPDVSLRRNKYWMLRVLDPAAAIAGRGFPALADAQVRLLLADPDLAANAGPHTLTVRDGAGSLVRSTMAGAAASPAAVPVMLGPRGFAALYAGTTMATLRKAGLAAGGDERTDAVLDALFASEPYLLDYF